MSIRYLPLEVYRAERRVKQLAAAQVPHTKKVLERQIRTTDREIDQLVYELYGLTAAEIKIVEESLGR